MTVVGDPGVGKTSLITRYVEDRFDNNYLPTLGVDFLVKNLAIDEKTSAKMVVWDIAGQESWKSKMNLYLKGAAGAIIICDVTRPTTTKHITNWLEKIKRRAGDIPYCVIGNKVDLEEDQKVMLDELTEYAQEMPCFLSSAKTGINVNETFESIAKLMIDEVK